MASPPLAAAVVAAAAGSGGEPSSGSEETGTAPPGRDLAALFEQAAERLPALLPAASKEQLLYLYARYKQVKFGTCNTPKPSFFDFEGKQKWEAWKALGDTSPHQAMQEYVATVKKLDPSWNPQMTEKRGKESKTAFGGPVVSSLYQEETIRAGLCSTGRATEDTRSWFQYCYSTLLTLTARESFALQCFLWPGRGGFLGPGEARNASRAELHPSFALPRGSAMAPSVLPVPGAASWPGRRLHLSSAVSGGAMPAWRRQQNSALLLDVRCFTRMSSATSSRSRALCVALSSSSYGGDTSSPTEIIWALGPPLSKPEF
ncbi:acyl-CoA-binding domain-containing protein 6 isoform X9 [Calonectris borealis]|uniref:acyl-CoA-binding domain-containing protein 6 isoform X9 n=1 Tax=Calonectris borealis TaxID=1323832 RepID=UPI003F4BA660